VDLNFVYLAYFNFIVNDRLMKWNKDTNH